MMDKRIAIIEDNSKIREGFAAVIENTPGYNVCGQYANCEDAIKHLNSTRPDLVLMDIDLPGMDGIERVL